MFLVLKKKGFPGSLVVKNPCANARDLGLIPGLGKFPGGVMSTHSSILAWKLPRTEEPGVLQSMGFAKKLDMTERLSMHTQST